MKKIRLLFSGLAVVLLVSVSLAFSPYFSRTVYCSSTCNAANKVSFRIDPNGTVTAPCGVGNQPYVLTGNTSCVATDPGTLFSVADAGN